MAIQSKQDGNTAVVSISGKLDGLTSPELKRTVRELIDGGTTRMVVDFHELRVITSVGISEILIAAKSMKEKGGQFGLVGVEGNVQKVFTMCGLGTLFHNYDSVADALTAMG
jgi:anti-anti-sigma factor